MKKIVFLLITLVAINAFGLPIPDNSTVKKDYIDPLLRKFDNKVWQNLLLYYNHASQIAKASLKEMNAVGDFCWASYGYLYAIERASNRAQLVWDNVKKFQLSNPVDDIIYMEEKVFQNSDMLFYYDIPAEKNARKKLADARAAIRDVSKQNASTLNDLMPDGLRFKKDYLRLMEMNSPDGRLLKDTTDADIRFHVAAIGQAAQGIAAADVQNDFNDNQGAILERNIACGASNGQSEPVYQSEFSKTGKRNSFLLSLQENVQLSEAIKTNAVFLLVNAKKYADAIGKKELLISQLENFAQELKKQGTP
jgi:hypothetical protein